MKHSKLRQNTGAATSVAIAGAAAAALRATGTTGSSLSGAELPVSSSTTPEMMPLVPLATTTAAVLYVDVVKNMPTKVAPPKPKVVTPPSEFRIFREDFPALPGTRSNSRASSAVPDDWTAILTDDDAAEKDSADDIAEVDDDDEDDVAFDDDDDDKDGELHEDDDDVDEEDEGDDDHDDDDENDEDDDDCETTEDLASDTPASASEQSPDDCVYDLPNINTLLGGLRIPETSSDIGSHMLSGDMTPSDASDVDHKPAQLECLRSEVKSQTLFDPTYLSRGPSQAVSKSSLGPPPGFENALTYARLQTNRTNTPMGGVTFDMVSPQYEGQWKKLVSNSGIGNGGTILDDVFGLRGLAARLDAAQRNPELLSSVFGEDLTDLNVNCNPDGLRMNSSYSSPLQSEQTSPQFEHCDVPAAYLMSSRLKLQVPKIEQMQVELLFLFFYMYAGDILQLLAAAELAERGWRYHKIEFVWLKRQQDNPNYYCNGSHEIGEYNTFNMVLWKIQPRYFELNPDHLEATRTKAELYSQYGAHSQMSF